MINIMNDPRTLDAELADFTDNLLAKREAQTQKDLQRMDYIVQQLYQIIQPNIPPSAAFRTRLTQRIQEEYQRYYKRRNVLRFRQPTQLMALAAAVAVVLLVGVLLTQATPEGLTGTAFGSGGGAGIIVVLLLVVVGAGVAFAVWRNQR